MKQPSDNLPKVITFDFYGTLVQWHEGLEQVFSEIVAGKAKGRCTPESVAYSFHALGRKLRDAPLYRPYREILHESLQGALLENGLAFSEADYARLITMIENLGPHPEVPGVLARLRGRFRLALISNSDDDLIARSVPNLGVPIDEVITAQQAIAYKPNPELFRAAHRKLNVTASEVVHVAASMPLDMPVCRELGIRAIWVNRRGERPDDRFRPFAEVADLNGAETQIAVDRAGTW